MSKPIYEYTHSGVFTLRITGRNEGRYARYCCRIKKDQSDKGSLVDIVEPSGTRKVEPPFYETRYFVRCDFHDRAIKNAFVNHKMTSVCEAFDFSDGTLVGTLDFVNAPGKFRFEIVWERNGRRESAIFEWMVVSEKLDVQKDYGDIVKTIEEKTPGLVRAFLSKSKGGSGLVRDGESNESIWADIFCDVADRYQRACDWITNRPHLKYVNDVEYRHAGLVKRWTPALVNRYASLSRGARQASLFRTEYITPEVDTVENRFVKFTLREISLRLAAFAGICEKHRNVVSENFVGDMKGRAAALSRIARKPFFAGVGRFMGFRQESMAMQRKQGYADIYATWVMLQKTIDASKTGFDTGHRPISALYEFWCFLKMAELLEKDLGFGKPEGGSVSARTMDDIFKTDDEAGDAPSLSAMTYDYAEKDGVKLQLLYQQNYSESGKGGNLAYCNPQRPDIVLVVVRGKEKFTYLFDAKYRVDQMNDMDYARPETINDMHRYRDAILYRSQEGDQKLSRQVIGAYVLYPGRSGEGSFDYHPIIEEENIGAIPLLPGAGGCDKLVGFLKQIVMGKKTAADHLAKDIPTQGTTVFVGNDEGEFLKAEVVYGTYAEGQLEWILENRMYNLPVREAEKFGITDTESAERKKILYLVAFRGNAVNRTFSLSAGVRKMTRAQLQGIGYPRPGRADDEYWVFNLDRELGT